MNTGKNRMLQRDNWRAGLNRFADEALELLPSFKDPLILDLGCGTGVPTIHIAAAVSGRIIACDLDMESLEVLGSRVIESGFGNRIYPLRCDIGNPPFKTGMADIIWSEGAIASVGFEKGLAMWKELIKPGGCIVLHDEAVDDRGKTAIISRLGFTLLGRIGVYRADWWQEYFAPMQKRIYELEEQGFGGTEELESAVKDLQEFKRGIDPLVSVFFVMRKN